MNDIQIEFFYRIFVFLYIKCILMVIKIGFYFVGLQLYVCLSLIFKKSYRVKFFSYFVFDVYYSMYYNILFFNIINKYDF